MNYETFQFKIMPVKRYSEIHASLCHFKTNVNLSLACIAQLKILDQVLHVLQSMSCSDITCIIKIK